MPKVIWPKIARGLIYLISIKIDSGISKIDIAYINTPSRTTETELLEFERKGKVKPGYNQSKLPGDLLSVAPHGTTVLNTW